MKKISYLIMAITSLAGCSKDCPDCYGEPPPFRIAILNMQGDNLLDPSQTNGLTIQSVKLSSGEVMDFVIKDYIIPSEPIGFYHLESIDDDYYDNCIAKEKECEIYIAYSNSSDVDTINVLIDKVSTKENGCVCTGFELKYVKYNGVTITEYDWEPNNTGSAIIRK